MMTLQYIGECNVIIKKQVKQPAMFESNTFKHLNREKEIPNITFAELG